jgi:hypothetical protein
VTRPHPSSPILVFSRGDAAIASSVGAYWVLSQLALFSPHLLRWASPKISAKFGNRSKRPQTPASPTP